MFDVALKRFLDPPLAVAARRLTALGLGADVLTVVGFVIGLGAVAAIAFGHPVAGLALLLASRLCDGLDGAVARQEGETALGAFLDAVLGLIVLAGLPFAFALADPSRALAALFSMFGLAVSGTTRLAAELFAAKRGIVANTGALTESTAIVLGFAAACLLPDRFSIVAYLVGVLCFVAAGMRVAFVAANAGEA